MRSSPHERTGRDEQWSKGYCDNMGRAQERHGCVAECSRHRLGALGRCEQMGMGARGKLDDRACHARDEQMTPAALCAAINALPCPKDCEPVTWRVLASPIHPDYCEGCGNRCMPALVGIAGNALVCLCLRCAEANTAQ